MPADRFRGLWCAAELSGRRVCARLPLTTDEGPFLPLPLWHMPVNIHQHPCHYIHSCHVKILVRTDYIIVQPLFLYKYQNAVGESYAKNAWLKTPPLNLRNGVLRFQFLTISWLGLAHYKFKWFIIRRVHFRSRCLVRRLGIQPRREIYNFIDVF